MRLAAFFAEIAPFLEGKRDHAATVEALYGSEASAGALDAERLAIYGRFCRLHRFEAVGVFGETRAAVVERAGEAAWERLVEDFFVDHPMHHFELNENARELPAWLGQHGPARGLPPWIAELADLEWATWRADLGPDDAAAGDDTGPLRIAPSVDVRAYQHDVAGFLDAPPPRPAAPARREALALVWRDRDLEGRRGPASTAELVVLKMVAEGLPLPVVVAATGITEAALAATRLDLHRAGILIGTLEWPSGAS